MVWLYARLQHKMYRIPLNLHLSLQADLKDKKATTSIFRTLSKSLLEDVNVWANGN
jgi:hypothetical protein